MDAISLVSRHPNSSTDPTGRRKIKSSEGAAWQFIKKCSHMADKNQYQAFLRAKVKGAVQEARSASTLTHQGVKGTVLEILVSKLFRPLLPSDIGIGTGQIIEQRHGTLSSQMDIVLYDRSILPPALYDDNVGIFPIEAVLYTIEVKTTLTASDLERAHVAAQQLSTFGFLSGQRDIVGKEIDHPVEKPRSTVFALKSDLTGSDLTEAQRYERIYKKKSEYPHIRAICVVGKEYCYDDGEYWLTGGATDEFDEVLGFIGGVTNTYRDVAKSRHFPKLGNYIVPEGTALIGPQTGEVLRVDVICNKCGEKGQMKLFSAQAPDIVFEGQFKSDTPCPKCGGAFCSIPGRYEFKKGRLHSVSYPKT